MLPSTQRWFRLVFRLALLLSLFLIPRTGSADDDPHVNLPVPPVEQPADSAHALARTRAPGEIGVFAQSLCVERPQDRPAVLYPLYGSFAVLTGFDVHSTFAALGNGGRETNPVVRGLLASRVAVPIIKAASAGAVVYVSEHLWKRNRTAAVLTMIAVNSAYGVIAAHNYSVARR